MSDNKLTCEELLKIKSKVDEINKQNSAQNTSSAHKFWETQPVPKLTDSVKDYGRLVSEESMKNRKIGEYSLPPGFEWHTMDPNNENDLNNVSDFINTYYLEDDDGHFRFYYSPEFLKWALSPPGQEMTDLSVVVQVSKSKKIVGFISGVIVNMTVGITTQKMADIDFLCVHPSVRNKSLASVLIKEVTRRVINSHGISQGIYSAVRHIPKPISSVKFYHKHINAQKLIDVGFADKSCNYSSTLNGSDIQNTLSLINFRKMELKDINIAHELLSSYMKKYTCFPVFSLSEFKHWFIDNDFVSSYVVVDKNNNPVDMISYFKLKHSVLKNPNYNSIEIACVYYYTCHKYSLGKLGENMLTMAKNEKMDVVNITDIMDNDEMINELKFALGTGTLYYYMFNWKCPEIASNQLGKCVF